MKNKFWPVMALLTVLAAVLLPISGDYYILVIALSLISLVMSSECNTKKLFVSVLGTLVFVGILIGFLQPDISIAILTALLAPFLFQNNLYVLIANTILLYKISFFTSISFFISSSIPYSFGPLIAPLIVFVIVLTITIPNKCITNLLALLISCIIAYLVTIMDVEPKMAQTVVFVPIAIVMWLILNNIHSISSKSKYVIILVGLFALLTWLNDLPYSPSEIVLILPELSDNPESEYFRQIPKVLGFVGITSKQIEIAEIDNLQDKSLIIFPWTTKKIFSQSNWETFKKKAIEKKFIVLLAAEHTNLGDNANRLNQLTRAVKINDDTTIPPGNTDFSGHLRTGNFIPFPYNSVLNRGASLSIYNPLADVLLAGDGWFADSPNHFDSVSGIGDYTLSFNEKRGQIILAASINNGARWIFIGDNSMFINRMLISNPKTFTWLISNVSLWQIFLCDLSILLTISFSLFFYPILNYRVNSTLLVSGAFLTVTTLILISFLMTPDMSSQWKGTNIGQGAFDEQNFNNNLVDWVLQTDEKRPYIYRHKNSIDPNKIGKAGRAEVHFGLIRDETILGDVKVSNCHRLGQTNLNNVKLMDAQSCKIDGPAKVLIGSKDNAAAFSFTQNNNSIYIILDKAFLINDHNTSKNLAWLIINTLP